MTDVIQIAQERRAQLRQELQKLDEFIRMAEMLAQHSGGSASSAGSEVASIERSAEGAEKGNGSAALRTNLFRQSGN